MEPKTAIIIGAGPAGLTVAYELLTRTSIKPIVLEVSEDIGGLSKTVNYKGNRIDIGGHRFFSKSDRVMEWWQRMMPVQGARSKDENLIDISYQRKTRKVSLKEDGPDPDKTDKIMLIRNRISRIFYLRKFFDYPLSLSVNTFKNLGLFRIVKIMLSYFRVLLFPIKEVLTLEDFFISRFGRELYRTFFKDYTEKVWGMPCHYINADWGAQRIKGLSVSRAVRHAILKALKRDNSLEQKGRETSLIEQFIYPKYGPGQMWEEVAKEVKVRGGKLKLNSQVTRLLVDGKSIKGVEVVNQLTGKKEVIEGDYVFSTMPVKDLINSMSIDVPLDVRRVAAGLVYRDFITVGLLLRRLKIGNERAIKTLNNLIPDNWIYIQERDVKIGRMQIFNNWSPYMVSDFKNTVWVGLEYFCNEGDAMWRMNDDEFKLFAIREMSMLDIIDPQDVLDSTIIRMTKTYPAYFGTYSEFDIIRRFVDEFGNLYLIGRNGMHKYNNQDHSMLTAMVAVDNIVADIETKDNIWAVNTEEDYHEQKVRS